MRKDHLLAGLLDSLLLRTELGLLHVDDRASQHGLLPRPPHLANDTVVKEIGCKNAHSTSDSRPVGGCSNGCVKALRESAELTSMGWLSKGAEAVREVEASSSGEGWSSGETVAMLEMACER